MFTQHGGTIDSDGYDFTKSENAVRWKGLFIPCLKRVMEQVHPRLTAKEDALFFVETLCIRILALLVSKPCPHSIQDVEEKIKKHFPSPIDHWAQQDARETLNSKKKKSALPIDRVHSLLQKDVLQYKIDSSMSSFIVAVLEYISADILKLAGNYVRKIKHLEITKEDIEVAMCADKVLMDMFYQCDPKQNVVPSPLPTLQAKQQATTTYEEDVKELMNEERQYQRDLHMIIRVFREELVKIVRDPKELEPIFSNIIDIYEVSTTLLGSIEDVIEMSEEGAPFIGSCFEEMAEAEEFDVYSKYAHEVTSQESKDALTKLLARPDSNSLMSAGHGFRDAVKYYLPKLLLVPVWHAFVYFDYIKKLRDNSSWQDDNESFEQVQGLLHPLRCDLENIVASFPQECCVPLSGRARRQLAIERTSELQNTVEHWDSRDVGTNCNEFIREDYLGKLGSSKRIAERKVYLFDGLMVLCKVIPKKQTPSAGSATTYDYRLKEQFFMRRVEINDRADTDELKNSFEIAPRLQAPVILTAKSPQHKNDWMADLIMVNTKSMLDRTLDSILVDIEKKHPLRMPSPEIYKFAVPDSLDNIVLEERESIGVPVIKGATLCKLVERLTYHIYADPMFVRTFLTTYRYFCTPQKLLELLIERFDIPDPSLVYLDNQQQSGGDKDALVNYDADKIQKNAQREDWKKYRREFVQPVQFRVLNVLRQWVDRHFYDFEKDPTLLEKLLHFLENVNNKQMRKWVNSVLIFVHRKISKNEHEKDHIQIVYAYGHSPPPIEHHLNVPESDINLLTMHPLELARQLTILEFELYKNVNPSELVGSPWTKKDKELKSPNLLKIMKHTTNVTRWLEKSIIESENYDERVAMVTRAIEVMMVLLELNNFNGIISVIAAMGSASVFRLKMTFQGLPARYKEFLEECRELNDGQLRKYQKRLRSINPPCVPFFGRYLTNILHLEEGNPDLLPNTELINFSKRRKVSAIIGEIQQYQNQPYCLDVDSTIRNFLENLDPFKGMSDTDISNYLYHESLRIEPRGCKQPPKFSRKWPLISLKSPGIKPRRHHNNNNSSLLTAFSSRSQVIAPSEGGSICGGGEQSPTGGSAQVAFFSIFSSVGISDRVTLTDRNGSTSSAATTVCSTPAHKNMPTRDSGISSEQSEVNGEVPMAVPQLPKKPNAYAASVASLSSWGGSSNISGVSGDSGVTDKSSPFSPAFSDTARLDTAIWNLSDEMGAQQQQLINFNNNPLSGDTEATTSMSTLPSPLPKVIVQPRHDMHSAAAAAAAAAGNRSPFQSAAPFSGKFNCSSTVSHFSPTDSMISGASTVSIGAAASPQQLTEVDFVHPAVPVSPHVNVPTAPNVEYRTAPPPLPPRRKERTESCADLAQKRQAPDAPTLPPRDGELSPPPIPPRLHHYNNSSGVGAGAGAGGTYPRSQTNEFIGSNNLLLPNTSSIMIRRNSAIEKRSAAATVAGDGTTNTNVAGTPTITASPAPLTPTSTSGFSSASSTFKIAKTLPWPSITGVAAGTAGVALVGGNVGGNELGVGVGVGHLNTFAASSDEQAISPALSSSTTTSPMTPMTPISPHIPTGYQIFDNQAVASSVSYHAHKAPPRFKTYSSSSPSTSLQPQQQQQQALNIHHHHPQQQQHPNQHLPHQLHHQQHHHLMYSGGIPIPPRTSPKDFYPIAADSTPKLPPKPSLSGNFYNNTEKGTMFLYPSTNQE